MGEVRFSTDGTTQYNGITVNTPFESENQSLTMADFLQLMIAEMKNQDFMGSDGGSQSNSAANYITQMAQMSTIQQMEQLAYYSKTNYAMSLVGKQATVATLGIGGSVKKETGIVEKVTLDNNEYLAYVNGKGYKLSEIMNVGVPGADDSDEYDKLKTNPVYVTSKGADYIRIRWDAPKVTGDEEKNIVYQVYYSTEKTDMNSVEDMESKATYAGSTEKAEDSERRSMEIDELEPGKTYYVGIVATSPGGVKYMYQTTQVKM